LRPAAAGFVRQSGSNAQNEQRHEADAGEQRRECHGIIFEPMPVGKHDVHPLFELIPQGSSGLRATTVQQPGEFS
jgi:hypothetical protein